MRREGVRQTSGRGRVVTLLDEAHNLFPSALVQVAPPCSSIASLWLSGIRPSGPSLSYHYPFTKPFRVSLRRPQAAYSVAKLCGGGVGWGCAVEI